MTESPSEKRRVGPVTVEGRWVRELRPTRTDLPGPACSSEIFQPALDRLGEAPVAWAVELALELSERASEVLPLGGRDRAVQTLRPSSESFVLTTLLSVLSGAPEKLGRTREIEQQVIDMIPRRVPLEQVLSGFRAGNEQLADAYLGACRRIVPPDQQAEQLELVFTILFEFANSFHAAITDFYLAEERRWLASTHARRDEMVRSILAGEEVSTETASRVLAYDLAGSSHVGMVFRRSTTASGNAAPLREAAVSALRGLGATAHLVMVVDRTEVWAWAAVTSQSAPVADAVTECPDVLVALGRPHPGLRGFAASHAEAQAAARVAESTIHAVSGGRVVDYHDVRLVALLTAEPGDALSFMQDELGRLGDSGETPRVLRETLRAYLECNCRPQDAARTLFVAKNTVIYRVRRAEELLGHAVRIRQLELGVALRLAAVIGPDAGPAAPTA
ncbi:helix-turn-helix domain-containing protein [Streptomyces sp. NPDC005827]|uniref:PucR family transcriptional regulator n=1 Tax=Streptomyces sp. NPDC005827 TaxID=3157070 RepID=UPI00340273A2